MFGIRTVFGLFLVCSLCAALNDAENTDPVSESLGSARILEQKFENQGDGIYSFSFKTSNGISREESAEQIPSIHDEAKNVPKVTGTFSYPGPDGVMYTVNFVADESGFHPEGDHFEVPPFTPWIPGQPIDDGQYKSDSSGQYKPDTSGQYKSDSVDTDNNIDLRFNNIDNTNIPAKPNIPAPSKPKYISGESILDATLPPKSKFNPVTPEYLPAPKANKNSKPYEPKYISGKGIKADNPVPSKPKYISGESILDATLPAKSKFTPVTSEYLPVPKVNKIPIPYEPKYISGESILDASLPSRKKYNPPTQAPLPSYKNDKNSSPIMEEDISDQYRKSVRVTTDYLPPAYTTSRPVISSTTAAFDEQATSGSSLLQQALPNTAPYTVSAEIQNTAYKKSTQMAFPQPFTVQPNSFNLLDHSTKTGVKYTRSVLPENEVQQTNTNQKFTYLDINPELLLLAGLS